MAQPGDSAAYAQATTVFSALGAVGNILLFAAQIPLVYRMHTVDRDASKYDPLPSYTLLFAMSLWSGYAVWVLPTVQLYVANFSGVILPLAYLFFFALHSHGAARLRVVATTLLISAAAWLICWGVYVKSGRADATTIGGAVTVTVNCTFFIAPLRKLHEAVALRDLSRVPVALSVVQFFQGLTWIIAAALLRDNFILGVNAAGWGFAILQLCVIGYVKWRGPGAGAGADADADAGASDAARKESPVPAAVDAGAVVLVDAAAAAAAAPEAPTTVAAAEAPLGEEPAR
jgi:hypothetical protein